MQCNSSLKRSFVIVWLSAVPTIKCGTPGPSFYGYNQKATGGAFDVRGKAKNEYPFASDNILCDAYFLMHYRMKHTRLDLTRFTKIATQGAPQMAVDKEANSLSRVYSYYSKFNLRLFYV